MAYPSTEQALLPVGPTEYMTPEAFIVDLWICIAIHQISRALRNVLVNDLLDCARREHRTWCWSHVQAAREKERQTAVVDMTDVRRYIHVRQTSEGTVLKIISRGCAAEVGGRV